MDHATFYREWFPLDKKEFRILAMLAEKGTFCGNLTDLCRYFSLNPQTGNTTPIRRSIEALVEQGLISCDMRGRSYILKSIPKGKRIEIPLDWFEHLRQHEYSSESVSWESVLKVYLWLCDSERDHVITNDMIAKDLNISVSTVVAAKNVLQNEYHAINKEYISEKRGEDFYVRLGQKIDVMAWWETS